MSESDQLVVDPQVGVLGELVVESTPVSGVRQRRLLSLLTIRRGSVASVEWLAEHLWGSDDRPDDPTASLRVYVSRLRQALPDELSAALQTRDGGYVLDLPPEAVDRELFAQLRLSARAAMDQRDPSSAHDLLEGALELWRGDPLPDLRDVTEFSGLRAGLVEDHLNAVEELANAALELDRHTQFVGTLEAHSEAHPLRERAWRQRAVALHRSGRTAEGLRVLDRFRSNLVEESGLDPTPEFIELEQRLLSGTDAPTLEAQSLRGYQLLERTGSGAFAVVWRGHQPSVDRDVAIKQIHANLASQASFIRRFEAEAHLVARLEHPHIVPLIDYWRDPTSAFLVMRWLPGGTLEGRLEKGPLSTSRTLQMAEQIGGALAVAHSAGIIHRDVKTANILLDDLGNFFLSDFGIALEAEQTTGPEAALSHGTPAYASPEQLRRATLDQRADVFSLGIVVFECLTGQLPFSGARTPAELLKAQLEETLPRVDDVRSDVPKVLADAIEQAVANDRDDRFDTVADFVEALRIGVAGHSPGVGGSTKRSSTLVLGELANPYRGLLAFDEADRDVFFGRERLVAELLARFADDDRAGRGVVLLGPSGSGKSSVARAGLLPALRDGAAPGSDEWFMATMVPGTDPFAGLEAALLRVAANPPSSLVDQLRDGPRGIGRGVRRCLPSDSDELLLFIDQFEELFTLCSADDQRVFLDGLSATITDPRSQLRVVVTLRADVYDQPMRHPRFAPLLRDLTVEVPPLGPDELESAITLPASRAGMEFEPGLVATISADTVAQKSPLPQLQHLLAELFDRRVGNVLVRSVYDDLGGMAGALASRAEELFTAGDETSQDATRRLFGRLAALQANDRAFRRRLYLGEVAEDDAMQRVIDQFAAARLLTFDHDSTTREPTVEVAHESLLEAWPRLEQWLEADRELLVASDVVRRAADTWTEGGCHDGDLLRGPRLESARALAADAADRLRPSDLEFVTASVRLAERAAAVDKRQLARLRTLLGAAAVLLVGVMVAGLIAWNQSRRADREADAARVETERARELALVADQRAEESDTSRAEAELATIVSRSISLADENGVVSMSLAVEAFNREESPATERALLRSLLNQPGVVATVPSPLRPGTCDAVSFVAGDHQVVTIDGVSFRHDFSTGALTEVGTPLDPCGSLTVDLSGRYQLGVDGNQVALAPVGVDLGDGITRENLLTLGFTHAGAARVLVFTSPGPTTPATAELVDPVNMATVGESRTGLIFPTGTVSEDGMLYAFSTAFLSAPRGEADLTVGELETGSELFTVSVPSRPTTIRIDDAANQVLAGLLDGSIVTIDVTSQAVVSIVSSGTGAEVWGLDVASDGSVLVLNDDGVTSVDRASGPIANGHIAVAEPWWGSLADDGSYAVGHRDGSVTVLDLDGGALVSEAYPIEGNNRVVFNEATAIVTSLAGGQAEQIDLRTGRRLPLSLTLQDGSALNAVGALPTKEGYVAVDPLGVLGQWTADGPVATLDLGLAPGEFISGAESDFVTLVLMVAHPDGAASVHRIDLATLTLEGPPIRVRDPFETMAPAPDGGIHVFTSDGMFKTYDPTGELLHEQPMGMEFAAWVATDAASGRLAVGGSQGAVVLEPDGSIYPIPDLGPVSGFAWARAGRILIVAGNDGSVLLWDAETRQHRGLLWKGSGSAIGDPSYDPVTDSVWVASDRRVVRLAIDASAWADKACELLAGRELTEEEWERFVPGEEPAGKICS